MQPAARVQYRYVRTLLLTSAILIVAAPSLGAVLSGDGVSQSSFGSPSFNWSSGVSNFGGTASVSGVVFYDVDHDNVVDACDWGVADAQVSLSKVGGGQSPIIVRTAKDGTFNCANLPAGQYAVQMITPTSLPSTPSANAFSNITLDEGYHATNYTFAQSAYPVALLSKRMLLNTPPGILHTTAITNVPTQSVATESADSVLVRTGTKGTSGLTITNIGTGNHSGGGTASNLNGSVNAISGAFTGAGGSFSLQDGTSQYFDFDFQPTVRGTSSSPVSIHFDNGSADGTNQAEDVTATLNGTGVGPVYHSDPEPSSTLGFGTLAVEEKKSLSLDISNITTDLNGGNHALTDLTLLDITLTGADSSLFRLDGFTASTIIHMGDLYSLGLSFDGSNSTGTKSALLTVKTDEGAALGTPGSTYTYQLTVYVVPEPSTLIHMAAFAGTGLLGYYFRRRKTSSARRQSHVS